MCGWPFRLIHDDIEEPAGRFIPFQYNYYRLAPDKLKPIALIKTDDTPAQLLHCQQLMKPTTSVQMLQLH